MSQLQVDYIYWLFHKKLSYYNGFVVRVYFSPNTFLELVDFISFNIK
jgi:hypothetical protein